MADAVEQARYTVTIYAPIRRIKQMIACSQISRSTVVLGSQIAQLSTGARRHSPALVVNGNH
jgi:hypothetical protein